MTILSYTGNMYMDESTGQGFEALIGLLFVLVIISALLSVVMYILQAIGMYGIAKNQGYDKPWLAWVPIANAFMIPILTEDEVHEQIRGKFTLLYGVSLIVGILFSFFIPFIAYLPSVLMMYGFYFIAKRLSERPVMHVVIAVVTLGLTIPVQLFMFRNRKPVA